MVTNLGAVVAWRCVVWECGTLRPFARLRWPGKQAVHGLIAGMGRPAPSPDGANQLRQAGLYRFHRTPKPHNAKPLSNTREQ